MKLTPEWNLLAMQQSPMFMPLHPVLARLDDAKFPGLSECNALLDEGVRPISVHNGKPLRFVAQPQGRQSFEMQYEPRCYLKGEVQTRENNWHDLFNALVWLAFPKTKAAINARHYQEMINAPVDKAGKRGSIRDMLTLLDESGVLVACADVELEGLLRNFQWKELFWQRRTQLQASMGFYMFGHGLYEKALRPYIGMTGQGLLLTVTKEFFAWPVDQRLIYLDEVLAGYLEEPKHGLNPRELTPVPLLGVPGWTKENDRPFFYDDYGYFRRGRLSSSVNNVIKRNMEF